jgi:DNA-binding GntR family transcriptional regulator
VARVPTSAAVEHLESLPDAIPWRRITDAHAAVHHEIVVASGNDRIIKAHNDCQAELMSMLAAIRGDFSARRVAVMHRHLLDQLLVGGDVALRALEDDLELG